MPTKNSQRLLERLDDAKRRFEKRDAETVVATVTALARLKLDAESLLRFHELLLFVRAHPANARVLRLSETLLRSFANRVEALAAADEDLSALAHPEASGIAGTSVTDNFSYPIVRWLVQTQSRRVKLAWDWFEDENRLSQTWPRFMPLLEEDAAVEANVPYEAWLKLAKGESRDLVWLVRQFEALPTTDKDKTELFDGQKLYVEWTPPYRATRTGMRLPVREIFFQPGPLIQRRDVSLRRELESPSALTKLTVEEGAATLELARETSTVRYRELYGFTHGDPRKVLRADLGRGVSLFVFGLPAGRRLPLRAYHAAMIFKNGIPVGYFEGLSLFERMESGFNFYYSFREGETAWIYARTLNVFRHLLGVTAFTLDPYQIGHENEEGIESGAFWFYRKLGFRPTQKSIEKVTVQEEEKIADRAGYRTSARTLRRLAAGPMIWELDTTRRGDWDRFQVRNIGFKVQTHVAKHFRGDPGAFRQRALEKLGRALKLRAQEWRGADKTALAELAAALVLIPDLDRWDRSEKELLVRILRAKVSGDEARYLTLMQKHDRLRAAFIKLAS